MKIMNKIDISFIIPVYNKTREQLEDCVKSINGNRNINYEIIIIDDGSKKFLNDIYKKIAVKYKSKFFCQKNMGVSNARNLGIRLAKGNYICFVDADDTINPLVIDKKDLINKTDLIIYNVKKKCNGKERIYKFKHIKENPNYLDLLKYSFSEGLINWSVAKLYSNNFLTSNKLLFKTNIKQGEDFDFVNRVLRCNPLIEYHSEVMYIYNFKYSTGDVRIKKDPLQALNDAKNDYEIHKMNLSVLPVNHEYKMKLYNLFLNETIKSIVRIYSIYLLTNKKDAKRNIYLFSKFLNKIGNNNHVNILNKIRMKWIINNDFFKIRIYSLLRSFYHNIRNLVFNSYINFKI